MISISFEKWHGCKNDFIVIQGHLPENQYLVSSLRRQAPVLCSKKGDGIGADGILYLRPKGDTHEVIVINADGTLAQNCGNGLRCVAASLWKANPPRAEEEPPLLQVHIGTATVDLRWVAERSRDDCTFVMVEMPPAHRNPSQASEADAALRKILAEQTLAFAYTRLDVYEIGNPHLLLWGTEATESSIQQLGHAIQGTALAAQYNTHLLDEIQIPTPPRGEPDLVRGRVKEAYRMLSWERGVGFTPACGSGACAAAVAILEQGVVSREAWVALETPGGTLWVQQKDPEGIVRLVGPAVYVYKGTFFL